MNMTAYIAGAEENETRWHDLRKDPSDLPVGEVLNQDGKVVWYDGGIGVWRCTENDTICSSIIAWCEIPTFKEASDDR